MDFLEALANPSANKDGEGEHASDEDAKAGGAGLIDAPNRLPAREESKQGQGGGGHKGCEARRHESQGGKTKDDPKKKPKEDQGRQAGGQAQGDG